MLVRTEPSFESRFRSTYVFVNTLIYKTKLVESRLFYVIQWLDNKYGLLRNAFSHKQPKNLSRHHFQPAISNLFTNVTTAQKERLNNIQLIIEVWFKVCRYFDSCAHCVEIFRRHKFLYRIFSVGLKNTKLPQHNVS